MDIEKIQKILNILTRVLVGALIIVVLFSFAVLEANKKPEAEARKILAKKLRIQYGIEVNDNLPDDWPPSMNIAYPDLALRDSDGKSLSLAGLKGKVLIIENVDMRSPVSQALSGAREIGPFGSPTQEVDPYALPIDQVLKKYTDGNVVLPNPDILVVKIIYYNYEGNQATVEDASKWAEQFRLSRENNVIVAVPEKDYRSEKTQKMIPGFQLLDRALTLRVDSSGPTPKHNLELTFAPLVPKLL